MVVQEQQVVTMQVLLTVETYGSAEEVRDFIEEVVQAAVDDAALDEEWTRSLIEGGEPVDDEELGLVVEALRAVKVV